MKGECKGVPQGDSSWQPHLVRWCDMPAHPTYWKVKAVLMRQARPVVRAPICVPPSQILCRSIGKPPPVGLADIFANIFRNSTTLIKPGNMQHEPHPNLTVISRESVLCEAGTGNIHQEQSLPCEVKVANLCEAVTGKNIYPNSRWQTCVKQRQETSTDQIERPGDRRWWLTAVPL
jgi:hypothetical protein